MVILTGEEAKGVKINGSTASYFQTGSAILSICL